jgi:hypothetical protein
VTDVLESGLTDANVEPIHGELGTLKPLGDASQSNLNDGLQVDALAEPNDGVPVAHGWQDSDDGDMAVVPRDGDPEEPITSAGHPLNSGLVNSEEQAAVLELMDIGFGAPSPQSESQGNDVLDVSRGEPQSYQTVEEGEEEEMDAG